MDGMKKYRVPVEHTATIVVYHEVTAKNMQDAMFRVGQEMQTVPDPFECVLEFLADAGADVEVVPTRGALDSKVTALAPDVID